jgi:hypothetical protein
MSIINTTETVDETSNDPLLNGISHYYVKVTHDVSYFVFSFETLFSFFQENKFEQLADLCTQLKNAQGIIFCNDRVKGMKWQMI